MHILSYVVFVLFFTSADSLVRSFLNEECIGGWEAKQFRIDSVPCYVGEWSNEITETDCSKGIYKIIINYYIERYCYQEPVDIVEFIHDGTCRKYFDFGSKTYKWYIATTSSTTCTDDTKAPNPVNVLESYTTLDLYPSLSSTFSEFRVDVVFHFSGRSETVLSGGVISSKEKLSLQTSYTFSLEDIILVQIVPHGYSHVVTAVDFINITLYQQHYEGTYSTKLSEFRYDGLQRDITLHSDRRTFLTPEGKIPVAGGLYHDISYYSTSYSMVNGGRPIQTSYDVNHLNQQPVSSATPYRMRSGKNYFQVGNYEMKINGFLVITDYNKRKLTLRVKAPPKSTLILCRSLEVYKPLDENSWLIINIPLEEIDILANLIVVTVNISLSVNETGGYPLQLEYDSDGSGSFQVVPRHLLFSLQSDRTLNLSSEYSSAVVSSVPQSDTTFTFETRDSGPITSLLIKNNEVLINKTASTYYFESPTDVVLIRSAGGTVKEMRLTRGEVSVLFRRSEFCDELLFPVGGLPEPGGLLHVVKYYGWLRSMVWIPYLDGDVYDKSNVNQTGELLTSNGIGYASTDNVALRVVGIINTTQLFNNKVAIRVLSDTETIIQIDNSRYNPSDLIISNDYCPYRSINLHYFQTAGPASLSLMWNNTATGYFEYIPREFLLSSPLSVLPPPDTPQPLMVSDANSVAIVIDLYTSRIELLPLVEGLLGVYTIFQNALTQSTCIDIQTIVKTNTSHWGVNGLFSCSGVALNGRGVSDLSVLEFQSVNGFYSTTAWKVRFSGTLKPENTTSLGTNINANNIRETLSPQLSVILGESLVYVDVVLDKGKNSSSTPDPLVTALVLAGVSLIVLLVVVITYFCCQRSTVSEVQEDDISVDVASVPTKEVSSLNSDVSKEKIPCNPLSVTSVRSVSPCE